MTQGEPCVLRYIFADALAFSTVPFSPSKKVAQDRKRQIKARQLEGNPLRAIEVKSDHSIVFSHELCFSVHKSYNLQLQICPQQILK